MYYVSVIDGPRYGFLLGPFKFLWSAKAYVERVRDKTNELDPRAWFWAFGTCKRDSFESGKLNEFFPEAPVDYPLPFDKPPAGV